MLAASALLLRLDARWMVGANYWDDMPVTSAWGLLALVNGPGFFLFKFLDGSYVVQLLGIAIFWGWTGFLLDRKIGGAPRLLTGRLWIRVFLHSLGFSFAFVFLLGAINNIRAHYGYTSSWSLGPILAYPKKTLVGREIIAVSAVIWGSAYVIYFSCKLWQAWGSTLVQKNSRAA